VAGRGMAGLPEPMQGGDMGTTGRRHIGGQTGGKIGKQVVVPGLGDLRPGIDLDKIRDRFEQATNRITELLAQAEERRRALENLTTKVDHIVVIMLENRSFDHMLGYLSLEGGRDDVDGLRPGMSNSHNGQVYEPFHLTDTIFEEDPRHTTFSISQQVENNNGGFVSNFAEHQPGVNPGKIMGYHNASDLSTYDYLAKEFTVCHRWFSSLQGMTWPNRLYATSGQSGGRLNNDDDVVPLYSEPSFFRHLDSRNRSWRWYRHDFPSLRMLDDEYRRGHHDNFETIGQFYRDVADGKLRNVSWIDPNFIDLGNEDRANDDHPPTDILNAQEMVADVVQALMNGPQWRKTLLVITYDEHGGFYDHVPPPAAHDDRADRFRLYGVRVPAIVVSPWVPRGSVSSITFDHTSIIKTVLLRFCRDANGQIPRMSGRVAAASHLGTLLTEPTARSVTAIAQSAGGTSLAGLRSRIQAARKRHPARPPRLHPPTDLQREVTAAKAYLASQGEPVGI
jgi:phospholipase C